MDKEMLEMLIKKSFFTTESDISMVFNNQCSQSKIQEVIEQRFDLLALRLQRRSK